MNQRRNFSVQCLEYREIEKPDLSLQTANETLCFENVVYQRNVPFFFSLFDHTARLVGS